MSQSSRWRRRPGPLDTAQVDRLLHAPGRLEAVRRSGLLDSPAEESFDSLTRLAARLLRVPVSFVSILDGKRDFYKSHSGLAGVDPSEAETTGRTFCHYTLASNDPLVIEDTHSDPVWRAVPTVESLGVRAYVGVPLKLDGQAVGSFCVMDQEPRQWTDDELETLEQLAVSAGRELGLRLALEQARDESAQNQALVRSREEVVAVVAHDLRTPLQILHMSAALLQSDVRPSHQPIVARMTNAIKALTEMANGLLSSTALLAPSGLRNASFSAGSLARDAVNMMLPIAERSAISLKVTDVVDASMVVDYARLLRVMGNLIGNAIKYSPPDSLVTVGATRDAGNVLITVADNGRGMTHDEQRHAFDQGWQGAEGMVRGDGAGLGLAIVKSLIEEQGGRVELASEPGRGTRVTICLPCS